MCAPYKYKQVVSFSHLTLLLQAESDDCVLSLSVFSEAKAKASPPPVLTYNQKSSEKCHVTKGMYYIRHTIPALIFVSLETCTYNYLFIIIILHNASHVEIVFAMYYKSLDFWINYCDENKTKQN